MGRTQNAVPVIIRLNDPHLFGQSLSRDLQNFNSSEAVMLQYVDDILLCAVIEEACSLFPVVVNR